MLYTLAETVVLLRDTSIDSSKWVTRWRIFPQWEICAEKTSSDIWWIGKVVVPLHSQLKRTGFRKCLSLMSGEQVLLVSVTLGVPIYNRYRTHERGARKKNFSENLVVPKSCRIFALATPKKGWSEVSDTWLEFGNDDS